jgi:hypothetical protein
MHQQAFSLGHTSLRLQPVRKETLEANDLQIIADLIFDGIRNGLYTDIIQERKRADIVTFLRHLSVKCEIRQYDATTERFHTRVAALLVYAVKGTVVGFSVLAEYASNSVKNGVELLMLGVVPVQRRLGYGASILNSLTKSVSQEYFNLIVKCPSDNHLVFAMLVMRGFLVVGSYCRGRVLRLVPSSDLTRLKTEIAPSRYTDQKESPDIQYHQPALFK